MKAVSFLILGVMLFQTNANAGNGALPLVGLPGSFFVNGVHAGIMNAQLKMKASEYGRRRESIHHVYCRGEGCVSSGGLALNTQAAKLLKDSCSGFLDQLSNSSLELSGSHVRAQDGYRRSGSAASSAFLRGFNNTVEYVREQCGASSSCAQALEDPQKREDFQRVCEEQVRLTAFTEVDDLGGNILNGVVADMEHQAQNHAYAHLHERAVGQVENALLSGAKHIAENRINITCEGKSNCFYLTEDNNTEDDCNLLDCTSMGADAVGDESFVELFNHMVTKASNFSLSGTPSFCTNCMKKVYEQTASSGEQVGFDEAKRTMEAKVEDNIAGKASARKILDWVGHLETLKNISYLNEGGELDMKQRCEDVLAPFLTRGGGNPCGGRIDQDRFGRRQQLALESAGLSTGGRTPSSLNGLMAQIDQQVEPKDENENSCREAYAFKNRATINNYKNKKYKEALDFVLNNLNNEEFGDVLSEGNCSGNSQDSFVKTYTKRITDNVFNILREQVEANGGDMRAAKEMLCQSSKASMLLCGDSAIEVDGLSREAAEFLRTSASEIGRVLDSADSRAANGRIGGAHVAHNLEIARSAFQSYLENVFHVPMKMDPAYKIALGSWKNVCKLHNRSKVNNWSFLETVEAQRGSEESLDDIKEYAKSACGKIKEELESAMCGSYPVNPEEASDEKMPYSASDIAEAQAEELKGPFSEREQIAANSLTCSLEGNLRFPDRFAERSIAKVGAGVPSELSDYEQILAANRQIAAGESVDYEPDLNRFIRSHDSCNADYYKAADAAARGERARKMSDIARAGETDSAVAVTSSAEEVAAQPSVSQRVVSTMGEAVDKLAKSDRSPGSNRSGVSSIEGIVTEGGLNSPQGFGSTPDASRSIASVGGQGGGQDYTTTTGGETATKIDNGATQEPTQFQNLFGYINEDSANGDSGPNTEAQPMFSSGGDYSRNAFSGQNNQSCDGECLEEVASKDSGALDPADAAEKVGLQGYSGGTEDLKEMFKDVLDGKLNTQELERLREENKKLQEEMASIRSVLEDRNFTPKVVDSNGVDRSESVRMPASNDNVVFNPRSETPEFRSRSYFEDKKEQFNPGFDNSSGGERVSLGNYSSQRRAAATRISPDKVRSINSDADRSFLQARTSATVDDNYVKQYVDHIGREAGSIEHLIVYENGRPAKIRVPDPENPGDYLEQPIDEKLAEEILEKVEKDEIESYALFNMVNFGQSLDDFMQALASEESDLTTLSSLNERLVEMRSLEN